LQEKSLVVGLTNFQVLSILLDLFFNTTIFKVDCLRRHVQTNDRDTAFVGPNENASRLKETRSFEWDHYNIGFLHCPILPEDGDRSSLRYSVANNKLNILDDGKTLVTTTSIYHR